MVNGFYLLLKADAITVITPANIIAPRTILSSFSASSFKTDFVFHLK